MSIDHSEIAKTLKNNIFLVREKLKKIDEDIKTVEKDVKRDVEKIVNERLIGITNNALEEKKKILEKINEKAIVDLKRKYLNEAMDELKKLEKQLLTKQKFVVQQNYNINNKL